MLQLLLLLLILTLQCSALAFGVYFVRHFSMFTKRRETQRTGLYKVCIDFWGYWSFCHFGHSQKWTGNWEIYLTFGIVWKWIFIELVCAQTVPNSVHVHHIRMGAAKRKSSLCDYSARKCYVYDVNHRKTLWFNVTTTIYYNALGKRLWPANATLTPIGDEHSEWYIFWALPTLFSISFTHTRWILAAEAVCSCNRRIISHLEFLYQQFI